MTWTWYLNRHRKSVIFWKIDEKVYHFYWKFNFQGYVKKQKYASIYSICKLQENDRFCIALLASIYPSENHQSLGPFLIK